VVGDEPTIADISICGYLFHSADESGYDIAAQYQNIGAGLEPVRTVPGWVYPYDILPGDCMWPKW
jgi:glutathione S-transferase